MTTSLGRRAVRLAASTLCLALTGAALSLTPATAAEAPVGSVPYMNFDSTETNKGVQITAGHPEQVGDASVYEILITVCNRSGANMPVSPESFSHTFGDNQTYYYTRHEGHVHAGMPQVVLGHNTCVTGSLVNTDREPNQLAFHDIARKLRIDILPATEWEAISKVGTPVTAGTPKVYGDVTGDGYSDVHASQGINVSAYRTLPGPRLTIQNRAGASVGGAFTWLSKTPDLDGNRVSDLLGRDHQGRMQYIRVMENGRLALPIMVGQNWKTVSLMAIVETRTADTNPWLLARAANGNLVRYQLTPQGIRDTGVIGKNWNAMTTLVSVGDSSGDRIPDLLAIDRNGTLFRFTLNASGAITSTRQIGRGWKGVTKVFSPGDLNRDGRRDLVAVRADGHLYFWRNLGNGRWGTATKIGNNWGGVDLVA